MVGKALDWYLQSEKVLTKNPKAHQPIPEKQYQGNDGQGLSCWLSSKEFTCQCRRRGFDPWVGKIPGGGYDHPLQYSCLGNPMDREAWWATGHRVAKGQAQLSNVTALR